MKKIAFVILASVLVSCSDLMGLIDKNSAQGSIIVNFTVNSIPPQTKGSFPDTNDFILSVCDNSGNVMYEGLFGLAPDEIPMDEGSYIVSVKSCDFNEPVYECPQYGDSQLAIVSAGQKTKVKLECRQINAGINLSFDKSFKTKYPYGEIYLRAAEGTLLHSYGETRTAFFKPGVVSIILDNDGTTATLLSRELAKREMLCLKLAAGLGERGNTGEISVNVDTSRIWNSEEYSVETGDAGDIRNAYDIAEAKQHIGEKGVWCYGYIVGGDLSASKFSYQLPFSSRTNIVLASKASCTDKEKCLSVQLAKGDIRDALNLVDNPENLGRQIYLKGEMVNAYYGIPGLENLTEFSWK